MARKANENCLENVRCPNCGNMDKVLVVATVWVVVTDDGADIDPDDASFDYEAESAAQCPDCEYTGTWQDFDDTDNRNE